MSKATEKKTDNTAKKSGKNATTNYAPDGHKFFCKRCFQHNGKCPKTGKHTKDSDCSL